MTSLQVPRRLSFAVSFVRFHSLVTLGAGRSTPCRPPLPPPSRNSFRNLYFVPYSYSRFTLTGSRPPTAWVPHDARLLLRTRLRLPLGRCGPRCMAQVPQSDESGHLFNRRHPPRNHKPRIAEVRTHLGVRVSSAFLGNKAYGFRWNAIFS
ncbi:hypothetical protein L596_007136 [Steinernema carpocapsae]|uniref:Uncharacterized protein n=1 Tax=Steinernema carpocapsae TaxID=34508 RepID=A0A4U5P930_STECR|nr:hypothetical protein L596_007136 [Steinernema carpocapsae]